MALCPRAQARAPYNNWCLTADTLRDLFWDEPKTLALVDAVDPLLAMVELQVLVEFVDACPVSCDQATPPAYEFSEPPWREGYAANDAPIDPVRRRAELDRLDALERCFVRRVRIVMGRHAGRIIRPAMFHDEAPPRRQAELDLPEARSRSRRPSMFAPAWALGYLDRETLTSDGVKIVEHPRHAAKLDAVIERAREGAARGQGA